jgi:hypothetical protein
MKYYKRSDMGEWLDVVKSTADILEEIDGVGRVVTEKIDIRTLTDFKKHLTVHDDDLGGRMVNAWFVERTGVQGKRGGSSSNIPLTQGLFEDTVTISGIVGYREDGSSTNQFQETVERVMLALLSNVTLGQGGVRPWVAQSGSVGGMSIQEIGDVVVHMAEIQFNVRRKVDVQFR